MTPTPAGDAAAAEIVEEFAGYLGRAMGIIACVTDPERFVIGGGVSKSRDSLCWMCWRSITGATHSPPAKIPPLFWRNLEMKPESTGQPEWRWIKNQNENIKRVPGSERQTRGTLFGK